MKDELSPLDQLLMLILQGNKFLYEKKYWGREGEVNFCFMLNELNKDNQEKFILESKNLLSNSTRVRFKESNSQEPKN